MKLLSLIELIESLAPLSFMSALLVGYYDPNSTFLGDIVVTIWQYTEIKDIEKTLINTAVFFFVDFSSSLASSVILWTFSKINLLKSFVALENEYSGVVFAFCYFLAWVSNWVQYFSIYNLSVKILST